MANKLKHVSNLKSDNENSDKILAKIIAQINNDG